MWARVGRALVTLRRSEARQVPHRRPRWPVELRKREEGREVPTVQAGASAGSCEARVSCPGQLPQLGSSEPGGAQSSGLEAGDVGPCRPGQQAGGAHSSPGPAWRAEAGAV